MRIIAGELKGRRIELPKSAQLRPTMDRVREAVFSSLQSLVDLEATSVVDLYAGSGALGFEALSRGAGRCLFVEKNRELAEELAANALRFGVDERAEVYRGDVLQSLTRAHSFLLREAEAHQPKIIFADPPYTAHPGATLCQALVKAGLLTTATIFILGAPAKMKPIELSEFGEQAPDGLSLQFQKSKTYGDTLITFYGF